MSVFTPAEIAYIKTQPIGRIATVGPSGKPHVVPVGFRYNPEQDSIDIGGMGGLTARKHYRDLVRNHKVAFVIDDIPSMIRIHPQRLLTWGVENEKAPTTARPAVEQGA